MQEFFIKNEYLLGFLDAVNLFGANLSIRAKRLYQEILQICVEKKRNRFALNYRYLEGRLDYGHSNVRQAFKELEENGLVFREKQDGTRNINVFVQTEGLDAKFVNLMQIVNK